MALLLDEDRLVPSLEKVARPLVLLVVFLGEYPVKLPHSDGEVGEGGFDQEVIMVVHQAVCVTGPLVFLNHGREHLQKKIPVGIVKEDRPSFVPA